MKHAILILAHKNIPQLIHLIEYFSKDCYVFVHIDRKSKITRDEILSLEVMPQVSRVYRKYSVHWAGFSILKCELFLLRQAIKNCDADYFHLISGQDYPIKPFNKFLDFFEENKGKEFLEFLHLPNPYWEHNTFERFQYYFPYDWMKRNDKTRRFILKFMAWQKKTGIKRRIPDQFDHLYGGSAWFSITRVAVKILSDYTHKHGSFYRRLHFTFCAEETYVTTVLVNMIPQKNIIPNNYRYMRWKEENGSYPANFGKEHFHLLAESDAFFARKFDSSTYEVSVKLIDKYLTNDSPISIKDNGSWEYDGLIRYKYNAILCAAIAKILKWLKVESIVDMGCGAGFYVAALRRRGFAVSGYDTNNFTPYLSSLLLPFSDIPCGIADLTDNMEAEEQFDMVLCLDVIQYIPHKYEGQVMLNLSKLTCKYLIISCAMETNVDQDCINLYKESDFLNLVKSNGFFIEEAVTSYLREHFDTEQNKKSIFVLVKK